MKKHRHILCVILAVLMLAALFAGCKGKDDDQGKTPASTIDAEQLKGYQFTIMGTGDVFPKTNEDGTYANQNAQELAEKLEDLEARLGITIEQLDFSGDKLEQVTAAAVSGLKMADLLYMRQNEFWPAAKVNALLPVDGERRLKLHR